MLEIVSQKRFNFWVFFLPLTVFTKEIGMFYIGSIQFDIISYTFFIIAFIVFFVTKRLSFTKTELSVFFFIFSVGTMNILLFSLPYLLFFKQFIPIVIIYFVTKYIISTYGVLTLFQKYVKYTVVVAIIGVVQIALKLVGISFLSLTSAVYVDSVALEPSHYVLIVLPALIYLYERKKFGWQFYLILATVIMTFKLTAILSIVLYVLVRNFNVKTFVKLVLLGGILVMILVYTINQIPEFSDRITTLLDFLKTNDISQVTNLTTFSFVSNFEIALENLIRTLGFGIGLGGHETMYLRHFNVDIAHAAWYGINYNSAHSLTIRVISEMGVLGILLYIVLISKTSKIQNSELLAVGWASVSYFIVKSIKLGGYFDYGTIFFLVMIIMAIKFDKNKGIVQQ